MARVQLALGVLLAVAGPPCVAIACRWIAPPVVANMIGQATLLLLAGAVVVLARRNQIAWEQLGVRAPDVITGLGGVALALVYMFVVWPALARALPARGTAEVARGVDLVAALPLWNRIAAVLIGGFVEEALFRGYAIAALHRLTQRPWLAGLLATVCFSYAHVPMWGVAMSTALLLPGAIGTAIYLWRRDLALLIIAHVITDAAGLLLGPARIR
jgi:membrane protease YdiL (CAAX protease family)